jgi:starch synthase
VVAALPRAQAELGGGLRAAIVSPLYRDTRAALARAGRTLRDTGIDVSVVLGGWRHTGRFVAVEPLDPAPLYLLDCPAFFDRHGIYGDAHGDFGDNALRFAMLSRGALDGSERLLGGAPDIVHAHDWHTGVVPAYARTALAGWLRGTRCVFTVHNLAHQGVFSRERLRQIGLDGSTFTIEGLEHYGHICYLKAGLAYAHAITAVSPSYAEEILTPAHGFGLDGFLRANRHRLHGILNGIDMASWDPEQDPHVRVPFGAHAI